MTRTCPRCQVNLQIMRVRDIELDACPKCVGLWFDSTELDKIIGGAKSSMNRTLLFFVALGAPVVSPKPCLPRETDEAGISRGKSVSK